MILVANISQVARSRIGNIKFEDTSSPLKADVWNVLVACSLGERKMETSWVDAKRGTPHPSKKKQLPCVLFTTTPPPKKRKKKTAPSKRKYAQQQPPSGTLAP